MGEKEMRTKEQIRRELVKKYFQLAWAIFGVIVAIVMIVAFFMTGIENVKLKAQKRVWEKREETFKKQDNELRVLQATLEDVDDKCKLQAQQIKTLEEQSTFWMQQADGYRKQLHDYKMKWLDKTYNAPLKE